MIRISFSYLEDILMPREKWVTFLNLFSFNDLPLSRLSFVKLLPSYWSHTYTRLNPVKKYYNH